MPARQKSGSYGDEPHTAGLAVGVLLLDAFKNELISKANWN
jgi:hypothetical protein